jgi:Kae1-associated kinase Bud32
MIIGRGAEAILEKKGDKLIKDRIKKGYRIAEIDNKLRKERTKKEMNLILAARRYRVNVPNVYEKTSETIEMEFINGKTVRDILDKLKPEDLKEICEKIGINISKLHSAGIIHGDLTTSNMILKDNEIYLIDFGLGDFSNKIENKAVDLHLLKEALISKHNKIWERCFEIIIETYKANVKDSELVINRLNQIEKRGRYSRKI